MASALSFSIQDRTTSPFARHEPEHLPDNERGGKIGTNAVGVASVVVVRIAVVVDIGEVGRGSDIALFQFFFMSVVSLAPRFNKRNLTLDHLIKT